MGIITKISYLKGITVSIFPKSNKAVVHRYGHETFMYCKDIYEDIDTTLHGVPLKEDLRELCMCVCAHTCIKMCV